MNKPALKVVVNNAQVSNSANQAPRQTIAMRGEGSLTQMLSTGSLAHAVHTLRAEEHLTNEDFLAFHSGIYGSRPPRRIPFANRTGASC